MITFIVVVVLLIILVVDLMPKWNTMGMKEKIVYSSLMAISFGVLILYTFNVDIPSPTTPITKLLDTLFPMLKQ